MNNGDIIEAVDTLVVDHAVQPRTVTVDVKHRALHVHPSDFDEMKYIFESLKFPPEQPCAFSLPTQEKLAVFHEAITNEVV